MKKAPYKRKPGDFEIRILKNGKVVMIAPNETLVGVAQTVDPGWCKQNYKVGAKQNAGR